MAAKREKGIRQCEIWFDGRQIPLERQDIWAMINSSNLNKVVVSQTQRRDGHYPLKTELITEIRSVEELADIPGGQIVMSGDQDLLIQAKQQGFQTCIAFSIEGRQALELSCQDASKFDYAVVDFDLPTNIPLELILARLQQRQTVVLKRETSLEGMEVALGVLEEGSDGVLLVTMDPAEILKASQYFYRQGTYHIQLHPLVVKEVRHIGMGARACIDTTSLMTPDEGMLVGSTSHGGIFVCSETHYLPYMNLRPFRVNAGAVHSYIWMPNDSAEYLTDLRAGSKVLCVSTKGEASELTVGRIKIEVRPLLLLKGDADGQEINVIVQDDWHIRLMGADGKPRNATAVQPGGELLAYVCKPGRHVGIKVDETIVEK